MGRARAKLTGAALADFNRKHPRGGGGRFAKGVAAQRLAVMGWPSSTSRGTPLSAAELTTARAIIGRFKPRKPGTARESLAYLKSISPRLPDAQGRAVERYSGEGLNFEVNQALARGDLSAPGMKRDVGLLREAARPLPDDLLLTRTLNKSDFAKLGWGSLEDIRTLKGRKVRHAAFASTSLGITYGGGWEITLKIAAPSGTRGIVMPNHSLNPAENEIVLVDGMDFAVSSVEPNGLGGYVISVIALPEGR